MSDLTSVFSTVNVAQPGQHPLVFGSMANVPQATIDAMEQLARLTQQAKQLTEDRDADRQDMHHLQGQVQTLSENLSSSTTLWHTA